MNFFICYFTFLSVMSLSTMVYAIPRLQGPQGPQGNRGSAGAAPVHGADGAPGKLAYCIGNSISLSTCPNDAASCTTCQVQNFVGANQVLHLKITTSTLTSNLPPSISVNNTDFENNTLPQNGIYAITLKPFESPNNLIQNEQFFDPTDIQNIAIYANQTFVHNASNYFALISVGSNTASVFANTLLTQNALPSFLNWGGMQTIRHAIANDVFVFVGKKNLGEGNGSFILSKSSNVQNNAVIALSTLLADGYILSRSSKVEQATQLKQNSNIKQGDLLSCDNQSFIRANQNQFACADTSVISSNLVIDQVITSNHVQTHAIESDHIKNLSILGRSLKNKNVESQHIMHASIQTYHIPEKTIVSRSLRTDTFDTSHFDLGAIVERKISDNAVSTSHLQDSILTTQAVKNKTILADRIQNSSVLLQHLSDNGITTTRVFASRSILSRHIQPGPIFRNSLTIVNNYIDVQQQVSYVSNLMLGNNALPANQKIRFMTSYQNLPYRADMRVQNTTIQLTSTDTNQTNSVIFSILGNVTIQTLDCPNGSCISGNSIQNGVFNQNTLLPTDSGMNRRLPSNMCIFAPRYVANALYQNQCPAGWTILNDQPTLKMALRIKDNPSILSGYVGTATTSNSTPHSHFLNLYANNFPWLLWNNDVRTPVGLSYSEQNDDDVGALNGDHERRPIPISNANVPLYSSNDVAHTHTFQFSETNYPQHMPILVCCKQ